jgi:tRNA-specific adenosine deaminase 1
LILLLPTFITTTMSATTTSTPEEQKQQQQLLFAADVAAAVTARFAALPKTGKPQAHEHTVLAGIVAYNTSSPKPFTVALGTGTKCLGGSKRSAAGDVLHDSHAEVIARRAFVAWAYQQLALAAAAESWQQEQPAAAAAASAEPSAFTWCPDSKAFVLRPGIEFALYVSQPPCGDASIYQGSSDTACKGSEEHHQQQQHQQQQHQQQQQRRPQSAGRTGAKLLKHAGAVDVADAAAAATADALAVAAGEIGGTTQQRQQQQQPSSLLAAAVPGAADVEAGPQQLGCVRRKPGKGDPTLSLSCSDKIARWCCLGLQGGLMAGLLHAPLYLSLLVIASPPAGGGTDDASGSNGAQAEQQQQQVVEQAALEAASRRAFGGRLAGCSAVLPPPFRVAAPQVVAVAAPDAALGLWPSKARKVPAGVC